MEEKEALNFATIHKPESELAPCWTWEDPARNTKPSLAWLHLSHCIQNNWICCIFLLLDLFYFFFFFSEHFSTIISLHLSYRSKWTKKTKWSKKTKTSWNRPETLILLVYHCKNETGKHWTKDEMICPVSHRKAAAEISKNKYFWAQKQGKANEIIPSFKW